MQNSEAGASRPDPFAALRHRAYRNLVSGALLLTFATMVQEVALAYELYTMTHRPLVLGIVGLAEGLPFIALALFGGHLADRRDRRALVLGSIAFVAAGSGVLWWVTLPSVRVGLTQAELLMIVYGVIAALGLARGIFSPAATSLRAFLVPRELYANATTWSSAAWQAGAVLGPVAAGFLYATLGLGTTLLIVIACLAASFVCMARIPRVQTLPAPPGMSLWQSLREGIDFVRRTKIILYSISLDLFSVLFGGVVAILPVFAADILKVGAEGLGILRAAPSVGAILTVLVCTRHPPTQHAWRNLLVAVTGFGLATLVFGVSRNFWLSVFALFLTGAFDSISVVIRGTILQVMPPDHLRGRVLSVNSIFLTSSNELGAFESGVAAQLLGTVPSVVLGGAVTLAIVAFVWRRSRELFAVKLA